MSKNNKSMQGPSAPESPRRLTDPSQTKNMNEAMDIIHEEALAQHARESKKLKQVSFVTSVIINYQIVDKFEGDIYLHDNCVSFSFKEVDYIVPLSNIRIGIKA